MYTMLKTPATGLALKSGVRGICSYIYTYTSIIIKYQLKSVSNNFEKYDMK